MEPVIVPTSVSKNPKVLRTYKPQSYVKGFGSFNTLRYNEEYIKRKNENVTKSIF